MIGYILVNISYIYWFTGDASQVQNSPTSFVEQRRIRHNKQIQPENDLPSFYKEAASISSDSDALYSNDDGSDGYD